MEFLLKQVIKIAKENWITFLKTLFLKDMLNLG